MKKTLLSLVLAGLASTAFAGQVYNYESASSKASVELNTEAGFNYTATRSFFDQAATTEEGKLKYFKRVREDRQGFQPFANFTAYGEAKDLESGFKFAFESKISSSYSYKKTRTFDVDNKINYAKSTTHLMSSPSVEEIAFTFGTDKVGYFRVGKTSTAANTAFAPMNSNNPFNDFQKTAATADFSFNEVLAYEAPVWNGLSAAVSFAKEHQAKYEFTNQVAGNVRFKAYGADVALTGYRNLHKADHHSQSVTKGASLSAGYSMYDAHLTFGAGYEATHQKQHPTNWEDKAQVDSTQLNKAYSFGLEASYDGFQYAKPYFGAYYVKSVGKSFNRLKREEAKTVSYSLGASSDVYNSNNVNVNLYVEGGYSREAKSILYRENKESHYLNFDKKVTAPFYFATGLTVSF